MRQKVAIGAGVLLTFLEDPRYQGIPSDVTELRGVVSEYMHKGDENTGLPSLIGRRLYL